MPDAAAYDAQLAAAARFRGTWSRLPGIDNETLVLHGTADLIVPPENALRIAAQTNPHARLDWIEARTQPVLRACGGRRTRGRRVPVSGLTPGSASAATAGSGSTDAAGTARASGAPHVRRQTLTALLSGLIIEQAR
jgi:hypothetical protein